MVLGSNFVALIKTLEKIITILGNNSNYCFNS